MTALEFMNYGSLSLHGKRFLQLSSTFYASPSLYVQKLSITHDKLSKQLYPA